MVKPCLSGEGVFLGVLPPRTGWLRLTDARSVGTSQEFRSLATAWLLPLFSQSLRHLRRRPLLRWWLRARVMPTGVPNINSTMTPSEAPTDCGTQRGTFGCPVDCTESDTERCATRNANIISTPVVPSVYPNFGIPSAAPTIQWMVWTYCEFSQSDGLQSRWSPLHHNVVEQHFYFFAIRSSRWSHTVSVVM